MTAEATLDAVLARTELAAGWQRRGPGTAVVTGVEHDSRRVRPGTMFCCVRGSHHDGHDFAAAAVQAGATTIVVDHVLDLPVEQVVVPDVRTAMGPLAAAVFGHPARRLEVVGVTGTNGKTTTVSLLADIFRSAGRPTGVIGTLTGTHTTPEAPELQARLAAFADSGVTTVAMEVSSHALALHRVDGMEFTAAVFTNLGRDHLDLHGTMEAYFSAKARLFEAGRARVGLVNVDDEYGCRLAATAGVPVVTYAPSTLEGVEVTPAWHRYRWRGFTVDVPLGARFNVANSLAAAETAVAVGIAPDAVVAALATASPVPGRFEIVEAGQDFFVVVDYAHTPDGLGAVLRAARDAAPAGRVLVVFGCGGDRDRDKRPLMGRVAAELADLVIVTSDNPRSEDPLAIIDDVMAGVPGDYRANARVEPDRETAMGVAFRIARPGDVVVVAGKGHETTQTIGSTAVPFDDRLVARRVLESLP